ncbi:MAG: M15 family metallopeptidase [Acidimicrobiia bacterium]
MTPAQAHRLLAAAMATLLILGVAPTGAAQADGPFIVVEVKQSGGFDLETMSLIDDAVRAVGADSTELHRVTLRLMRVTRGEQVIQQAPVGYGYPMLTMAVDPETPVVPVDLRAPLARGEAVMGEITARLRGAEVGDVVELESLGRQVVPVRIGAIVPDQQLRWSELWLGSSAIPDLGFDRPYSVVAWGERPTPLAVAIGIWTSDPDVRVIDGSGGAGSTDPVLPVAIVKERFGEFALRPAQGDTVLVDPGWRNSAIVTVDFPIVGQTRCHRMVAPYIRAALNEVEQRGLASVLDRGDFQLAGGCFNPRFNRGADPGYSLSRHSWGIAVDFNPSTNRYGEEPSLSSGVVEIFQRWGFSWGGNWSVPDGMHFEWHSLPVEYSTGCSDLTAVADSTPSRWTLLPAPPGGCR